MTNQATLINQICSDKDIKQRCEIVSLISTSQGLYDLLDQYNWNDGFDIPQAIAEHIKCDRAIAQRMYWLASADWYCASDIEVNTYNQDHYNFSLLLTERLLSGFYKIGSLSHSEGFDRVALHLFKKKNMPNILYLPVIGKE